jgi:hypothetical protein
VHSAQGCGERGLCFTYWDPFAAGNWGLSFLLSFLACPVVVGAGLAVAAVGVLSTCRQASSQVRRVSWAGLIAVLLSALVYWVIFGLWFLGNLLCDFSKSSIS